MALDTGNYISDFDNVNPPSSDPVSQGDDVLRFIKTCLQFALLFAVRFFLHFGSHLYNFTSRSKT